MVGSLHTYARPEQEFWLNHNFYTYILLNPGTTKEYLEPRLNNIIVKYVGPAIEEVLGITLDDFSSQGDFSVTTCNPCGRSTWNRTWIMNLNPTGTRPWCMCSRL